MRARCQWHEILHWQRIYKHKPYNIMKKSATLLIALLLSMSSGIWAEDGAKN